MLTNALLRQNLSDVEKKRDELETRCDKLYLDLTALRNQHDELKTRCFNLEMELITVKGGRNALQDECEDLKNQLELERMKNFHNVETSVANDKLVEKCNRPTAQLETAQATSRPTDHSFFPAALMTKEERIQRSQAQKRYDSAQASPDVLNALYARQRQERDKAETYKAFGEWSFTYGGSNT